MLVHYAVAVRNGHKILITSIPCDYVVKNLQLQLNGAAKQFAVGTVHVYMQHALDHFSSLCC
jgi:hypothetical protein